MHEQKISVIIPVYNVAQYLRRCVNSVLNQTYRNIEVVLVNDGSTDNCGEICDEYLECDSRVKVIHQKNKGLSGARNTGLKIATGDYILFVDSDDWIDKYTCEYSISLVEHIQADALQFMSLYAYNIDDKPRRVNEKVCIFQNKDILQYYMKSTTDGSGDYSMCNCLFSSKVLSDLTFREGKINEDIDFKYKALSNCKKLIVTNRQLYYYFQPGESISVGGLKLKDFDLYESAEILYELTRCETYGTIAKLGYVKKARTALSLLCKIAYYGIADKNIDACNVINKLTQEHRSYLLTLLSAPLPMSRKFLAVLFAINFNLTKFCIDIVKKII